MYTREELQQTFTFQQAAEGSLSLNNLLGNTMFNHLHCLILIMCLYQETDSHPLRVV